MPKRTSASERAGLQFPVARIRRYLRKTARKTRVSPTAAVYLTAVMEYLVAEVMELSGQHVAHKKGMRIKPRHILLGTQKDAELHELTKNSTFFQAGVMPDTPLPVRKA